MPMTQPAAPENLLKVIFCSCKEICGAACGCRKSGLFCTPACVQCSGEICTNRPKPADNEDEIEDID